MALIFASGEFVNHGSNSALDNMPAFTLWAWVYRTANGGNQHIFTKDNSYPSGWSFVVDNVPGEGALRFVLFRTGAATDVVSGALFVPLNTWTFVCVTYDNAANPQAKLYTSSYSTNAAEVSTYELQQNGTGTAISDAAASLYVGNLQRAPLYPFLGRFARESVINRALSLSEINIVRHETLLGANVSGTKILSDSTTTAATQTDYSGSGNDGALTGGTLATHLPFFGITTASLPNAANGAAYSENISYTNAATPITSATIDSGVGPGGLSLAIVGGGATVNIAGTISAANGAYSFTVKLVDTNGNIARQAYTITITGGGAATVVRGGFGVVEHSFTITDAVANPDENVVGVVTYTPPTGSPIAAGLFHYGGTSYKSRIAPNQSGAWSYSASIVVNGGSPTVTTGSFTVGAQTSPGFIKKHATNNYRWISDDGTPFNPSGIGDCFHIRPPVTGPILLGVDAAGGGVTIPPYPPPYEGSSEDPTSTWANMATYAATYGNGGAQSAFFNMFRLSPANCARGLIGQPGSGSMSSTANIYDKANSILYDTFITTLISRGFRIMFCPLAFTLFENSTGAYRTQIKKYFKYCSDRWGAYVDLWDIVNEGDTYASDAFLNDVGAYLKTIDPYDHPVTSSFSPGSGTQHDFTEAEFTSPHGYALESEFSSDTYVTGVNATYTPLNKPILWGESGNDVINYDATSDVRMRIRLYAAFFSDGHLLFWNASSKTGITGAPANQYIGQTARNYVRHHQNYTNNFPAATSGTLTTSDAGNLRGYRLSAATMFGAYIHCFGSHTVTQTAKTVTIAPTFAGTAQWVNPATGANVGASFATISGSQTITIPDFTIDITLKIVPSGGGGLDTTPPTNVGTITGVPVSTTQINDTWAAATDVGGSILNYRIERATNPAFSSPTQIDTINNTPAYNHTGLAEDTTYYRRVKARDLSGNLSAAWSPTVETRTLTAPPPFIFIETNWTQMDLVSKANMEVWHTLDDADDGLQILDYSGNNRTVGVGSLEPELQRIAELNNQPAMYFDGTRNPLFYTGAISVRHVFAVVAYEDALFSGFNGILSDKAGIFILHGNPGTANFFTAAGYGASNYLKSDVTFPISAMAAPVSRNFAVVEILYSSNITLDGWQIGQDRTFTDRKWKGWFVEDMAFSVEQDSCQRQAIYEYFAMKFFLWRKTAANLDVIPFANAQRTPSSSFKHVLESTSVSGAYKARSKSDLLDSFDVPFASRRLVEFQAMRQFFKGHFPGVRCVLDNNSFYPREQFTGRITTSLDRDPSSVFNNAFKFGFVSD